MAPLMADYAGRGIGEDGDAKRPPLVFSMAKMLGSDLIRFQRGGDGARGLRLFGFSTSKV